MQEGRTPESGAEGVARKGRTDLLSLLWWFAGAWSVTVLLLLGLGIGMFEWKVSLGDLLTVIVPVLIGATVAAWRLYTLLHPFRANYIPGAFTEDVRHGRLPKTAQIHPGDSVVRIRIRPRRVTTFQNVNVRCVLRPRWSLRKINAPANVISVIGVRDYYVERGWPFPNRNAPEQSDERGGIVVDYDPPYVCPQGEALWLRVTIRAHQQWHGQIGIRNLFGESRRQAVHLNLRVIDDRKPNRQTKVPLQL